MIRRIACAAVAMVAVWCAAAPPAFAERLVASLSTHRVVIASNFSGVDLTLFGAIEPDAASVGRAGGYGVVITVAGPRQTTVTWRKDRVFGVWVNASSRTFIDVPSYLAVLSNRPLDAIAAPEARQRFRTGLAYFPLQQNMRGKIADPGPEDPYRRAFVQLKTEQRLYRETDNAVTFITPMLFRTSVPIPANVTVGTYEVEIVLFAGGSRIAGENTAFEIVKSGFEQFVAQSARDHSLLYGLATTMLALLTGWLGAIVFRRD